MGISAAGASARRPFWKTVTALSAEQYSGSGTVDITVPALLGASAATSADRFSY
jgi:hypothetical protein